MVYALCEYCGAKVNQELGIHRESDSGNPPTGSSPKEVCPKYLRLTRKVTASGTQKEEK